MTLFGILYKINHSNLHILLAIKYCTDSEYVTVLEWTVIKKQIIMKRKPKRKHRHKSYLNFYYI